MGSYPFVARFARAHEQRSPILHHELLGKLKPGARYWYQVGSEQTGWSRIFEFVQPDPKAQKFRIGVAGDLEHLVEAPHLDRETTLILFFLSFFFECGGGEKKTRALSFFFFLQRRVLS